MEPRKRESTGTSSFLVATFIINIVFGVYNTIRSATSVNVEGHHNDITAFQRATVQGDHNAVCSNNAAVTGIHNLTDGDGAIVGDFDVGVELS